MRVFSIQVWGVPVSVECTIPDLIEPTRELLLPTWTDIPDLQTEAVFRITTSPNGTPALEGPDQPIASISESHLIDSLENRLHLYLAHQSREAIYIHAGAVKYNDRVVLLPGPSLSGKSTLVHALVQAGASYLSDEYSIFDKNGLLYPFPRPLSLRKGNRRQKVPLELLNWDGKAEGTQVTHIFLTRYSELPCDKFKILTPGIATLEVFGNAVSARSVPEQTLACLGKVVRSAVCWKGERGDVAEIALKILGE